MTLYGPDNAPIAEKPEPPPKRSPFERIAQTPFWRFLVGTSGLERILVLGVTAIGVCIAYAALNKPSPKPSLIKDSPFSINTIGQTGGTNTLTFANPKKKQRIHSVDFQSIGVREAVGYRTDVEIKIVDLTDLSKLSCERIPGLISFQPGPGGSFLEPGIDGMVTGRLCPITFITSKKPKKEDFRFFLKP